MATTNDTDPQREQPIHDDVSRTEPDSASANAANAASLLAGLSGDAQPTQDVAETEGHVAAAYAVAPHRPPRPNEKTVENPGVFINATVPLPQPPSSGHVKLGPPAPPVVSMKGEPTVLGGARLVEALANQTDPGERAKNQLRVWFAAIAGVMVAALIAIAILMSARATTTTTPTVTSAAPTPSVSASAPPIVAATASTEIPPSAPATTTPTTTTTTTTTTATTKPTSHGRPHGSSPAPRSSGNFAEPDRHL